MAGKAVMGRRSSILAIGSVYIDINATGFPFETGLAAEQEIVGARYEATQQERVKTILDDGLTLSGLRS